MTDTSTKSPSSKSREPTFNAEEMRRVLAEAVAEATAKVRAEVAAELTELKAKAADALADKPAKMTVTGRTERSIRNELLVRREFKKHGFGEVTPHKDVKTFGKWQAECRRPLEGSKAVKAGGLRLFHVSQTRPLTAEELGEAKVEANKAKIDKAGKSKGKSATVVPIGTSPQS